MSSVSDAIRATRSLVGGDRDPRNRLLAGVDENHDILTFEFPLLGIQPGVLLELGGGEVAYVWSVDAGSKTATVQRGEAATDRVQQAGGQVVRVSPGFLTDDIRKALRNELHALVGEGMFRPVERPVTFDERLGGFDITNFADEVLSVVSVTYTHEGHTFTLPVKKAGSVVRAWKRPAVDDCRLVYRAPFVSFEQDDDDLVSLCGLPESAVDVLPLGAAVRLLHGKEGQRVSVDSQSHARRPEDVPVQGNARQANQLAAWRRSRVATEVMALRSRYPIRVVG